MDYYEVLGLSRTATEDEVRRAYRKLALKHHPDKGGDGEIFQTIGEAYAVLSDPEKRDIYNKHGKQGLEAASHMPSPHDFTDVFDAMFRGRGNGVRRKEMELNVTLEEVYVGKSRSVEVTRRVVDHSKVSTCDSCGGRGCQVRISSIGGGMYQQQMLPCVECRGEGTFVEEGGFQLATETIVVDIPQGCHNGTRVIIPGMMDEEPGMPPGDLVFVLKYKEHQLFVPQGPSGDLSIVLKINLLEALTGFQRIIKHLDGTFLQISIADEVTTPTSQWSVYGEGLIKGKSHLHVRVVIEFPQSIEDGKHLSHILRQKRIIQKLSSPTATIRNANIQEYKETLHQGRPQETTGRPRPQECTPM